MFYTEDHQATATENKMETESSSISGIQGKHKKNTYKSRLPLNAFEQLLPSK